MKILAGDIGGTKTRLALFDVGEENLLRWREENSYESRLLGSLEEIVEAFMSSKSLSCDRACFGIAGPVTEGIVETTNLPWDEHEEAMRAGDPAVVITQTGLSGQCQICSEALDLFVSLYGSEAGNLALKVMATGGVYLGGGIAPKILERLKGKMFMSAFLEKGRMRKVLEKISVKVILNDKTALLGAARCAVLDKKDERVKTCSH